MANTRARKPTAEQKRIGAENRKRWREHREERLNSYGSDNGDYGRVELNRIRFSNALSHLESILRNPGMIGAELGGPIYRSPETFTAQKAIEDFRELDETLSDVLYLAASLPSSPKLKEIQVVLNMIDLGQMDMPAESAMMDGHEEEAIAMLQETVQAAYEEAGCRLKQLAAEYAIYERGDQTSRCQSAAPKRRKRGRTPEHTAKKLERASETYEAQLGEGLGSKGAWNRTAELTGFPTGEAARIAVRRWKLDKINSVHSVHEETQP